MREFFKSEEGRTGLRTIVRSYVQQRMYDRGLIDRLATRRASDVGTVSILLKTTEDWLRGYKEPVTHLLEAMLDQMCQTILDAEFLYGLEVEVGKEGVVVFVKMTAPTPLLPKGEKIEANFPTEDHDE